MERKKYQVECGDGTGTMDVYPVYPGITLIYNDFQASGFSWKEECQKGVMEINYCRMGREEAQLKSGAFLYLGEGDLSVHMMENCAPVMNFPLKKYSGITVTVELSEAEKRPPEILERAGFAFAGLKEKLCRDDSLLVIPAREQIEHIFAELYSAPEAVRFSYMELKVQELLLFLAGLDVSAEKKREQYLSPQVEIIKEIHKSLTENLAMRPSIDVLAKEHHINSTSLKSTFKGVYGKPLGSYMKEYRMKRAADLLRETSATVADVAAQVGYENQSKFSAAFREIMKLPPHEYRKVHRK